MNYCAKKLGQSQSQSLLSSYDYILTQIKMKYIHFTQAYFKPKNISRASRYIKTRLTTYKPTDRNKTLKKLLLSCGEKPQEKLRTTKQNFLHILK